MFKFDSMGKSCAAGSEEMFHPQSSRNDNREAHVLYDYFTQRFAQAMNWPLSGRDILELGMKLLPYQEASKPLKSNQFGTNERC